MPIILPSRFRNPVTGQADMTQDMIDLSNIVTQINAGSSPITYQSLEAINSAASVAVPTTPTIQIAPTVVSVQGIGYDNTTGILTSNKTGTYQISILVNAFSATVQTVFFATDIDPGTGTFAANPNSGRQEGINANINGQLQFISMTFAPQGYRFRVYVWASGAGVTFQTTTLAALPTGTVIVPATHVLITGQ